MVKQALSELLLSRSERSLRLILRAVVYGNPDTLKRTEEMRVAQGAAILLGRKPARGAPRFWRDDMLEAMAFWHSVETLRGNQVSIEQLAKAAVNGFGQSGKDPESSVAKDLVRKFVANRDQLLAAHSY